MVPPGVKLTVLLVGAEAGQDIAPLALSEVNAAVPEPLVVNLVVPNVSAAWVGAEAGHVIVSAGTVPAAPAKVGTLDGHVIVCAGTLPSVPVKDSAGTVPCVPLNVGVAIGQEIVCAGTVPGFPLNDSAGTVPALPVKLGAPFVPAGV